MNEINSLNEIVRHLAEHGISVSIEYPGKYRPGLYSCTIQEGTRFYEISFHTYDTDPRLVTSHIDQALRDWTRKHKIGRLDVD